MKKALIILPIIAAISACSTTNAFDKQASEARERQEKNVVKSIDNVPDWMANPPENTSSVVYATASAVSGDMAMADEKAKAIAAGKICTSAGGTVDKTSKVYMLDAGGQTQERSEMAIRSKCRQIDVTGVQTVKIKRVPEGTKYRTYVLVALPLGDANILKQEKIQQQDRVNTKAAAEEAFREIDEENGKVPAPQTKAVPIGQLNLVEVDNAAYKAKRDEALQKPGAVVGQVTLPM
jgi:hypothetical protein